LKVSKALRRASLVKTPEKPRASFLLLGPTGTGKTEIVKQFTNRLFGSEDLLHRFDMADFQHDSSVKEFRGDELGNSEGRLAEVLKKNSHGTLLFDEMEKAHPKILTLFLSMMSAARMTSSKGVTYNLEDYYIVFTSNIASDKVARCDNAPVETLERIILNALLSTPGISPEFVNRFSKIVVFRKLKTEHYRRIAVKFIESELELLNSQGHSLDYHESLVDLTLRTGGVDTRMGARPMERCVSEHIRDSFADHVAIAMKGRSNTPPPSVSGTIYANLRYNKAVLLSSGDEIDIDGFKDLSKGHIDNSKFSMEFHPNNFRSKAIASHGQSFLEKSNALTLETKS